jgi:hypothetical protein
VNAVRTTLLLIAAGALLMALLFWLGPMAHADEPGAGDLVCQQLDLGYTPAQIAEQLHQGDPRYNDYQAAQTVWDAIMQRCD